MVDPSQQRSASETSYTTKSRPGEQRRPRRVLTRPSRQRPAERAAPGLRTRIAPRRLVAPLAPLHGDDNLEPNGKTCVGTFFGARDAGWIEPETVGHKQTRTTVARFVIYKVLRQYFEATGDKRTVDFVPIPDYVPPRKIRSSLRSVPSVWKAF